MHLQDPIWLGAYAAVASVIIVIVSISLKHFRGVTRGWLSAEIFSYLKNDDTPIAVYQHQTRDKLDALSASMAEMHSDLRESNRMLSEHMMNHQRQLW